MRGYGQAVPTAPTEPSPKDRELRARLIIEEALETCEKGLGVTICQEGTYLNFDAMSFKAEKPFDMIETVDGCADVSVVTIGTLAACGVADRPVLEEVDNNNLLKIATGSRDPVTGKFIKAKDHPAPDIRGVIKRQSMVEQSYSVTERMKYIRDMVRGESEEHLAPNRAFTLRGLLVCEYDLDWTPTGGKSVRKLIWVRSSIYTHSIGDTLNPLVHKDYDPAEPNAKVAARVEVEAQFLHYWALPAVPSDAGDYMMSKQERKELESTPLERRTVNAAGFAETAHEEER